MVTSSINRNKGVCKNNFSHGKTTLVEWNAWKDFVGSFYLEKYSRHSKFILDRPKDKIVKDNKELKILEDVKLDDITVDGDERSRVVDVNRQANLLLVKKKEDNRPYINVKIFDSVIVALLDTGASHSVFGGKGLKLIDKFNLKVLECPESNISTADGTARKISG